MHCNAVTTTTTRAYRPGKDHWISYAPPGAPKPQFRHDGWTPFRQQVLLGSVAEGNTVALACAGVTCPSLPPVPSAAALTPPPSRSAGRPLLQAIWCDLS
jgi:hypothetical protein